MPLLAAIMLSQIQLSASTVTYVLGRTLYHKGYIPPIAIPPPKAEGRDCHQWISRVKLGGGGMLE